MLNAQITNSTRKKVYRRDGFRCSLCDDTRGLQIHHIVRRSKGGTDYPHNLITLCWRCHAAAHGTIVEDYENANLRQEEIEQAIIEYAADHYAEQGLLWNPWEKELQMLMPP